MRYHSSTPTMTDSAVLTWLVWLLGCQVVAGMSQAVLPRKEAYGDLRWCSRHSDFNRFPA